MFEGGRLIGTNLSDRIMVSAGRHDIELVNEAVGYRMTRTVQVTAGKVAAVKLEMPRGTISVNASPGLKCGSTANASARRRSATSR